MQSLFQFTRLCTSNETNKTPAIARQIMLLDIVLDAQPACRLVIVVGHADFHPLNILVAVSKRIHVAMLVLVLSFIFRLGLCLCLGLCLRLGLGLGLGLLLCFTFCLFLLLLCFTFGFCLCSPYAVLRLVPIDHLSVRVLKYVGKCFAYHAIPAPEPLGIELDRSKSTLEQPE